MSTSDPVPRPEFSDFILDNWELIAAVVCHGPACEPPDSECGPRDRGRPCWPVWEWPWLAERLKVVA